VRRSVVRALVDRVVETGERLRLDAVHAHRQTDWTPEPIAEAPEQQHRLIADREVRRTNRHRAIGAHFSTGQPNRHKPVGLTFDERIDRHCGDRVDCGSARANRPRVRDVATHDQSGVGDDLFEFRGNDNGGEERRSPNRDKDRRQQEAAHANSID